MSGEETPADAGAPTSKDDEAADRAWRPKSNPWLIAVVVTLAAFMEILDTTIVNVSLPHIAGTVSVSYDDATWALTSYLVANGIVLTISGWFSRLFGRKRYFLICIAMFTVCSFLCGLSNNLVQLVLFRLLQGFFGGLQPNQQSIILDTFEPARRGQAFSVVAIAVIFAPVIGPTLGGYITDTYSWRWIFFINIPVGILAFFAVLNLVEDPPWVKREHVRSSKRIDYIGVTLITIGLGCLQVMLDRGEDEDWFSSHFIVTFAVLAAVGLVGAVAWLTWTRNPVVKLTVFRDRNFSLGCVMIVGFGAILYSSNVIIPQLAQQQMGYTAELAGLILSPGAALIILLIPIVGKLVLPYIQTRFIIAFGFLTLGSSCVFADLHLVPNLSFNELALIRCFQTLGLAFLFVPNSTIAYSTLPKELNGDGSALFVMLRNVSGAIGISLAGAMITERTQVHHAYLSQRLTAQSSTYQNLIQQNESALRTLGRAPGQVAHQAQLLVSQVLNTQAAFKGYMDVFALIALISFCVVPLTFLFRGTKAGGGGPPAH
jgi:DHA2 family multidrug resistance protein